MLVWGIGSGVGTASLAIAKALGRTRDRRRPRATTSSRGRGELGADAAVNHATGDVARGGEARSTDGRGVDVVVEHVGEATWATSLAVVAPGGRVAVCGATTGPNPPAQLHRIWWKQLTVLGSTMGTREDFEAAYELVAGGPRAAGGRRPVFPLADARAAHERLERGEHSGKIVLRIPD